MIFTHIGTLKGADNRTPKDAERHVNLRETKLYWISRHGIKYRKKDGWAAGQDFPMWTLDLNSVVSAE